MLKAAVVVVTGAGSGIGQACAELVAHKGFEVLLVGRRQPQLDRVAAGIAATGARARTLSLDVGGTDAPDALSAAVVHSSVKALIHCAAVDHVASFEEVDEATWDDVLATNLKGPFFATQGLLPAMGIDSSVTFVGSPTAKFGRPNSSVYGAAKGAIHSLTRNLAVDLAPVRVNCVVPGPTRTPMYEKFLSYGPEAEAIHREIAERSILGRPAEPTEVASTIIHVALEAMAMTGAIVDADMGFSAKC